MITPFRELENIVTGISFQEYRELPGLNFHFARQVMLNPKLARSGWYDRDRVESDEMRLGTQFHELCLQGEDVFLAGNALWEPPRNPKTGEAYGVTTKAYKEAFAEWEKENSGKRRYTAEDKKRLDRMMEAVANHKKAREMLFESGADNGSEVMFSGVFDDLLLKGSIDRYDDRFGIIDLKTTACVADRSGYRKFRYRTVPDYGYMEQIAFYQIAVREVCGAEDYPPGAIVAVETVEPFQVEVVLPVYAGASGARDEVYRWIDFYRNCVESGEWVSPFEDVTYLNRYRPNNRYVGVC